LAYQVSGSAYSVNVVNPVNQGDTATALRVVVAGNSDASVVVNSGTITAVTSITNTVPVMQVSGNVDSVYALNPAGTGDAATALRVVVAGNSDVSVTATQTGTWNIGTVTTVTGVTNSIAANIVDSGGVPYTTTNPLPIGDAGGSITVDGTVSLTGALTSAVVVGDTLHDAVDDAPAPIKIGAKALASLEGITVVAAGDRTNLYADVDGVLVTKPHTTYGDIMTERTVEGGSTTAAFITFAAGGAGVRNYVTSISIHNSSATDAYVDLFDGIGGEAFYTLPAPKTGGSIQTFEVPLKQPTANANLAYKVSGSVSSMFISVVGFQSKI
jgi:hypothetical protein